MTQERESAELLGLRAAAWLAGQDDLLSVFLGSTGASIDDFRTNLESPEFQGAVLDFLLMNDEWVTSFCNAESLPYDRLMRARALLPGGDQVHWT
ncbi:DUF3572 domain-containing protein [Pacificoceanicola onchidii]|uniref:DUF3572 domain-containing protein n=1 Tax=Pacificoceanicola onchidii TaxID=2562685 RepID=UPI0010A4CF69|nr:DUF3572 domain-containing protein [Pacificoceanicola onchidii]